MLRRRQEINTQIQQVLDSLLLLFALWAAYALRVVLTGLPFFEDAIPPFERFRWMIWVILPAGPLVLEGQGYYVNPFSKRLAQTVGQLLRALVWLGLLVGVCVMFLRLELPARAVLVFFVGIGCGLLAAKERLLVWSRRRRAAGEHFREPVLLAGPAEETAALLAGLDAEQLARLEVVGRIDIGRQPLGDLVAAMRQHAVSRVIFAAAHSHLLTVQEAIGACETEGVEAWLAADFIKTSIARADFDTFGERPMLVFRTTPDVSWSLVAKRVLDLAGALVGLLLTAPVLAIAWVAIRLTTPGPVIFRQLRGGKHGKPFTMYKFRTMHTDAEMRQAELQAMNQMSGPVFKVERDPRVTPVGRLLRKWSVDELPQLLNVLRGEMSLVGPRPLPLYEVERFEHAAQRRRLSVPPGLTCLWQISGRNEITDFRDWVRLDLLYIDNWSLWLDVKILLKTIPAVLLGSGAK